MSAALRFILLDAFDPSTAKLRLRIAYHDGREGEEGQGFQTFRATVSINDILPLEDLQRDFRSKIKTPMPKLWVTLLKDFVSLLQGEIKRKKTFQDNDFLWIRSQCFHPTEPQRSTPYKQEQEHVDIIKDWVYQMEAEQDGVYYEEFLSRGLLIRPKDPVFLRRMAYRMKSEGRFEETCELVTRWLHVEPESIEAMTFSADCDLGLGKVAEAQVQFQKVVTRQPKDAAAYLGLAQCALLFGQSAIPFLDAAIELDAPLTKDVLLHHCTYRLQVRPTSPPFWSLEQLPEILGLSPGEIKSTLRPDHLHDPEHQGFHPQEISQWVTVMNRFQLLKTLINWNAPTSHAVPSISESVQ